MKNYIIIILAFCLIQFSCKDASIEAVDPISLSSDKTVDVVLSKDYIEGANSYFFSNGIVLVELEDSMQGKIIMVDSLDIVHSQWSEDKAFMIYCDKTYNPLVAKNSKFLFCFDYDENGELIDINATDTDGNTVTPLKANSRKKVISKVSTEGWTSVDDLGAALTFYETVNTIYNPTPSNIGTTIVSWLSNLLPEGIPQDLAALAPGLVELLQGGRAGLLGSILGYAKLIQDIGENRAKILIGDCTPYIKSANIEGNTTVNLNFQILGVTSTSQFTPYYVIRYWQEVNGSTTNVTYYTEPQIATNGTHSVAINNLNGGRYGFQLLIFPSLFLEHDNMIKIYNFRSNIVYVDIPRVYFKSLEQSNITYVNNHVTVSMKAVLDFPSESDKTILSYYNSYGVYVYYNNNVTHREDYYSVKENGNIEFYINIDLPRDEFSCDYNNFVATCGDEIVFKTYSIDGWGIKEFYDERNPKIVYNDQPSIYIKSVWSRGTVPYTEENDYGWDTHGNYSYSFEVKGAFFIEKLYHSSFGTSWHTQFEYEIPFSGSDGTMEYSSGITYKSGINYPSTYYGVYGTTPNGNEILPNNYIQFLGDTNYVIVNSIGSSTRVKTRRNDFQDLLLPMNVPISDK